MSASIHRYSAYTAFSVDNRGIAADSTVFCGVSLKSYQARSSHLPLALSSMAGERMGSGCVDTVLSF